MEQERQQKDQQDITLKIAGRSYSLTIEREKEEVYRLAAREVNGYIAELKKQNNFRNWKEEDYLSVVALRFAIKNVDLKRSREVNSEELRQIEELSTEVDDYLNRLTE